MSLLTQIFGSRNQRLLKQYQKTVREINALRQTPGQQYSYLSPTAPEGAFYYTRLSYDF